MDACALISSHFEARGENTAIVLGVKNQQENIESVMRGIIRRNIQSQASAHIPDIIVIDLGSTDDTLKILSHFEQEYAFVHVTNKEDYIASIRNMV